MICKICGFTYYNETLSEPAESCACGETVSKIFNDWGFKDTVKFCQKYIRCHISYYLYKLGDLIFPE